MIHVLWYTDRMLEAKITHTISPDAAYRVPADQAERERALDIRHSYLVQAPAGSGKTELLTQRALVCLAHVQKPEEVLVVTFTNKAVNEARARVLDALTLAASNEPPAAPHKRTTWKLARKVLERDRELGWNLARHPSRLRIMTIDKLNSSLAGQLPVLSGLGGPAQIEERAELLYEEAVHKLFVVKTKDAWVGETGTELTERAKKANDGFFTLCCWDREISWHGPRLDTAMSRPCMLVAGGCIPRQTRNPLRARESEAMARSPG